VGEEVELVCCETKPIAKPPATPASIPINARIKTFSTSFDLPWFDICEHPELFRSERNI